MSPRPTAASLALAITLAGCMTHHAIQPQDLPALARGEVVETLEGEHVILGDASLVIQPHPGEKFADLDGLPVVKTVPVERPLTAEQRVPRRYDGPVRMQSAGNWVVIEGRAFRVQDIASTELLTDKPRTNPASRDDKTGMIVGITMGALAGAALLGLAIYGVSQIDLDIGMGGSY